MGNSKKLWENQFSLLILSVSQNMYSLRPVSDLQERVPCDCAEQYKSHFSYLRKDSVQLLFKPLLHFCWGNRIYMRYSPALILYTKRTERERTVDSMQCSSGGYKVLDMVAFLEEGFCLISCTWERF